MKSKKLKIIILGEAGSGKSTIARYIANSLNNIGVENTLTDEDDGGLDYKEKIEMLTERDLSVDIETTQANRVWGLSTLKNKELTVVSGGRGKSICSSLLECGLKGKILGDMLETARTSERVEIDDETGDIYILIRNKPVYRTVECPDKSNILYDYDCNDELVGIEILK